MNCPRCHAANREGSRFCEDCGARLSIACPSCRAEISPGKRYCAFCGASLPASPDSTPSRATEAQVPSHLAERILASRSALEGERKQVTVLFADIKGSMELLADRDPEEARSILDPVLEGMIEAVHRYEGMVNQVMGDGIMALFGAPLAHEDHAVRACYAALRMQGAVRQYAEAARRAHGVSVRVRIGLNSGEVVVRAIGGDLHMDYTAVGQTTHLAARLEQLADPGSILLSAASLKLAEGFVDVRPLGSTPVKGLKEAVEIFELTGVGVARTRLQASAMRGLTAFIGRDTEMEQLHHALERARQGSGQLVAVVGEPGVGKSRLFYEFVRSHRLHGWLVLESGSVSYGKASAYLPVIDLLKNYFKIGDADGKREVREKITGKLLALNEALKPALSALFALFDVAVDDPSWHGLDPPDKRRRTLDAVKQLLFRESEAQPLVLVFEDLHWVDEETQALLDGLVEGLPGYRMLLLANYRPEYRHEWGNKSYYTQIGVDTLPAATAAELLSGLLGDGAGLAALKALLIERTSGNPFFLEECVRDLVETGILAGERGAYRLERTAQDVRAPATVHGILAARIDRLPADDKTLLQCASVIGKDVPAALLQAIVEHSEPLLRAGLARLQVAEFLYETRLFPDLEYTFKHALTHEVTYRSLVSERRRLLHARIVAAIERLYPDRLAERTEELSHHAVHGELWEKAVLHLRHAGQRAFARSTNAAAAGFLQQALEVASRLPETRTTDAEAVDLRLELRSALMPLGEFEQTREVLRAAEMLAEKLGDRRRLGWIAGASANLFWELGEQACAIDCSQRALHIACELDDPQLTDLAYRYLGRAYHALGEHARAIDALRHVIALRERRSSGAGEPASSSSGTLSPQVFLISCLTETGAFDEAATLAGQALHAAEAAERRIDLTATCAAVGRLHIRQGKIEEGIAVLERGLHACRIADVPLHFPMTASTLGAAYAMAGRVSRALPLLREAVERSIAMRRMVDQSLWMVFLGEALLRDGKPQEAEDVARRALVQADACAERGNRAWALHLLAEIRGRPEQRSDAAAYYGDALQVAEDLGMRPLQAHCHVGLGLLHQRAGRREEGLASLGSARRLLRDMDMTRWLPRVDRALDALGSAN
ncbi:MAG TPA: AAA family ATPase [Burkholderiales bacterium]|nr:AAA family ATPase [Burkholderiales bacterium]